MGRGCGNCGSGAKDAHSPKPASRPNADQGAQPQSEAVQPHTSNINQRKSSTSQVAPRNAGNTTAVAPQTRIAIDPAAPGPAATQSSASKTATVQPAPSPNKIAVSSTGVSPAGKPETSINSIHVQSTPVAVPTGATHSPKAAAPPTTAAAGSANSNSTQLNELAALLKNVPLLSKLNDAERATLGSALVEKTFAAGSRLVVEGEEGKEFFIIKSGEARVTKKQADGSELELCLLKTYDYMGETALQSSANRRMATITATKETVCFTMERSKFSALFGKDKLNVTFAKRQAVSAETYTPDAQSNVKHTEVSAADRHKSTKQRDMILAVVKTSILFNALNPEQQASVVDTMWLKKCTQQETVIRQGDLGDYWYIVESGQFDIFLAKKDVNAGAPQKVASRAAGSSFGELALLYNAPRAATVTAVSADAAVWVLDRWTFRKILTTSSDLRLKEYEQFLRGVQSFQVLLDYERAKIAEALEEVSFTSGAKIVTQGDTGSTFFILKQGTVIVTVQPQSSSSDQLKAAEVARYEPGAFFGERALVRNEVRAATCTASGPVTCLYLNRDNFNMLLGPMEDIFKERVEGYNAALSPGRQVEADKVKHESDAAKAKTKSREDKTESYLDASIKLADLKVLGTLGKGSFGHVQLVKSTVTGSTYALKTVSKAQVVNLGQQEHIMSEKKAMASLNHPFLIRLHATFKDRDCLYFLLEPSLGGELFSVLRAKTFFDEATARFFAAGVVLAFEYMHSRGIVYRDLKPENLLLDSIGYLKITDFGFAKKIMDGRTWTLCGTPDYLAPEVVSGQGHGKGVDWWTLGILIYEMLASYPPFYDEDPMKTYAKIMHGQVAFPLHFSKSATDLIKKLLHPKATKRLGVLNGGARLVREHAWFQGFDWDQFLARKLPAPIILPVKSSEDLSNFEEYPDDGATIQEYKIDPKNPNPDWEKDF